MTKLQSILIRTIGEEGPLPIDRYMALCLSHPQFGYYMNRDPFGTEGDFTTSPEISQVFGELLGIWVAQAWQSLGSPRNFALVELGPGRGTLMADIVRVLIKLPDCAKAADIHFVEMSPTLREAQRQRVPNATWHSSTASLPAKPTILLANEFFDALPIRQFERKQGRVYERCIGVENAALNIGLVPSPRQLPLAGDGIYEDSSIRDAVATQLGDHLSKTGGYALVIDYGHLRTALGDTLQALKNHRHIAITEQPGEADITSHVDLESLARAFMAGGARIAGIQTQGEFLQRMGLEQRTLKLTSKATPQQRTDLLAASTRLAHPDQMGQLFKVMAISGPDNPVPYPFGAA